MRTIIHSAALMIAILIFASGCAVTDLDHSADFSTYKTFRWGESDVKITNPLYDSDLIDAHIKRTVGEEFAKRGLRLDNANADLLVSYKTYTEQRQVEYSNAYGYAPYYPWWRYGLYPIRLGWGYPYWAGPERVKSVTQGTLIIDVSDAQTKQLLWRGSVGGDVGKTRDLHKQIQKGIKAILKRYPVAPEQPLRLPDRDIVS